MRRLMLPEPLELRKVGEEVLATGGDHHRSSASLAPALCRDGGKEKACGKKSSRQGPSTSARSSTGRESTLSNPNRRLFGVTSLRGSATPDNALSDGSRLSSRSGPCADVEPPRPTSPHRQVKKGPNSSILRQKSRRPLLSRPVKGRSANVKSGDRHLHKAHTNLRTLTDLKLSPLAPRFSRLPSTTALSAKLYARSQSAFALRDWLPTNPDILSDLLHGATPEAAKNHQDVRVVSG
ncbi:unnamed protein product [Phytomonas sp. EM1]|nr:unnamed protein product [Phytomonas sp. EM1]|eukprot:CCW61251.1 unnamed protein product [Phytomonas sp. isolate EM1]